MTRASTLRAVETVQQPAPSLDYEWQDRQRIMGRNWSAVHVAADKRSPLPFWNQVRRSWSK